MNEHLEKIASQLVSHKPISIYDNGLLSGRLGEVFFLYFYSVYNDVYREYADTELVKILNAVADSPASYRQFSYCNGLAGLGVALHILEQHAFIETTKSTWHNLDQMLAVYLQHTFRHRNYDFLHGAIGIGFYYLKHWKCNPDFCTKQIEFLISYLKNTAVFTDHDTVKWREIHFHSNGENELRFNISLSHGISSIVLFLARVVQLDILSENHDVLMLLNKALNYILAQELPCAKYGCYFPSFSLESDNVVYKSRLAWCYGDLGIGFALWRAGKIIGRADCEQKGIEVLEYAARMRRDLLDNSVFDAGLCHGSAGIAQVFYRMSCETSIPDFYSAYKYWLQKTLEFRKFPDGLVGFKAYNVMQKSWENKTAILEGIAGIGLMLLSSVISDWDEILLLSFNSK